MASTVCAPCRKGLPCVLMGLSAIVFALEDKRKAGNPTPAPSTWGRTLDIDARTSVLILLLSSHTKNL